ncbi:hypothetical protein GGX14DRAFT_660458 [Mycena pura]|uniref:Uncharacterized protein n=1 Tax=Mycena pura TaxID=153505 RepID=A0AAD6Y5K8_9AGAR|nr:hypothetical protein GGX14DRAFT_660458 [Mycena pura]
MHQVAPFRSRPRPTVVRHPPRPLKPQREHVPGFPLAPYSVGTGVSAHGDDEDEGPNWIKKTIGSGSAPPRSTTSLPVHTGRRQLAPPCPLPTALPGASPPRMFLSGPAAPERSSSPPPVPLSESPQGASFVVLSPPSESEIAEEERLAQRYAQHNSASSAYHPANLRRSESQAASPERAQLGPQRGASRPHLWRKGASTRKRAAVPGVVAPLTPPPASTHPHSLGRPGHALGSRPHAPALESLGGA